MARVELEGMEPEFTSSEHNSENRRPGRRPRPHALMVGLLALVVVVFLPSAAARAVDTPRMGIAPAYESNYFHISLTPGGQTTNTAVVSNYSDRTSRIRIYAVDAGITPQGQFALNDEGAPRQAMGSWIVPSVSELTLSPRSSAHVDFALAVPPGAAPRDYAGGIVLEGEPRAGDAQDVGGATAVQLTIVERLGVRVYLKVEGDDRAHLVAGPLTSQRVSSGATEYSFALRNDGNVQLSPAGVVTLDGFGLSGQSIELSRPELLLPGTTTTVRARWHKPALYAFGQAKAVVTYGDGQTAHASVGVRIIPVKVAAVLALLFLAISYLAYRLIRFVRRARSALRAASAAQALA